MNKPILHILIHTHNHGPSIYPFYCSENREGFYAEDIELPEDIAEHVVTDYEPENGETINIFMVEDSVDIPTI